MAKQDILRNIKLGFQHRNAKTRTTPKISVDTAS